MGSVLKKIIRNKEKKKKKGKKARDDESETEERRGGGRSSLWDQYAKTERERKNSVRVAETWFHWTLNLPVPIG